MIRRTQSFHRTDTLVPYTTLFRSATPASAQQTGPDAPEAKASGTALGDIVVTAQRREQRADDVGVTINVLSGDDLEAAGTQSIVDLAAVTPNVQIKNVMANSITNVSIRGIGLNDYAVNNNPAAGIYVDNVYLRSEEHTSELQSLMPISYAVFCL